MYKTWRLTSCTLTECTHNSDDRRRFLIKLARNQSSSVLIYIKLSVMAFIWGGTFIVGRILVQSLSPFSAAFWRHAIASLCLLVLTLKLEGRLPKLRRQDMLPVIVLGLSSIFAYNAFFSRDSKPLAPVEHRSLSPPIPLRSPSLQCCC